MDKKTGIDDFLTEFIPKRSTAHSRRIKAEKVADMIRSGGLSNGAAPAAPYPNLPYPSPAGPPLPYPTNYNMPMPGF